MSLKHAGAGQHERLDARQAMSAKPSSDIFKAKSSPTLGGAFARAQEHSLECITNCTVERVAQNINAVRVSTR